MKTSFLFTFLTCSLVLPASAGMSRPIGSGSIRLDGAAKEIRIDVSDYPKEEMTIAFRFRADSDSPQFPGVRHANGAFAFSAGRGFSWYEVTGENGRRYDGCAHPSLLEAGKWHDVAFTFDQKNMAVYWGGRRVRNTEAANLGKLTGAGGAIRIGGGFKGEIADFRIFDVAVKDWPEERARRDAEEPMPEFGKSGFAVLAADSMAWVTPSDRRAAQQVKGIELLTAANERESVQLFVYQKDADKKRLEVGVPAKLRTAGGRPASFEISVGTITYSVPEKASHYMYENTAYPDRIVPGATVVRDGEPCFAIWLDVKTPKGTKPGKYSGTVKFSCGGGQRGEVPLTVDVKGFELPARNEVRTIFNIWERDLLVFSGSDTNRFVELVRMYGDMLLEHRLNPQFLYEPRLIRNDQILALYPIVQFGADGTDVTNWGPYDSLAEHFRTKGLSTSVPGVSYGGTNELGSAERQRAIWKCWRDHFASKGWLADAIAYPVDEWSHGLLAKTQWVGDNIKGVAPEFKWLVTGGNGNMPAPDELNGVDIWCPQLQNVNLAAKRRVQKIGVQNWFYVCTGPQFPAPNLHGDTPLAAIRMVPGAGIRFGFDGLLHWGVNFNTGRRVPMGDFFGCAEGQLMYPDEEGKPIATCRLRSLGDGMEDWLAADMLKKRKPSAWAKLADALAALIPERKYDPATKVTWSGPDRASFKTFLPEDAFYGVYTHRDRYLAWRRLLYDELEKAYRRGK